MMQNKKIKGENIEKINNNIYNINSNTCTFKSTSITNNLSTKIQ